MNSAEHEVVSTQILSRAVTFVLNVLVARLASPEAYGVGYVSLQLLSNLILFAAKEGFRKVALRAAPQGAEEPDEALQSQSSANLGWCGFASGAVAAGPLAFYWLRSAPASASWSYQGAVLLTAVASVLEGVAEPFVIRALAAQEFQRRAAGEAGAILARTFGMLFLTLAFGDVPLAFGASQLLFATVWLAWLAWPCVMGEKEHLWQPSLLAGGALVLPHHWALLVEFAGMVLLKLALTEGEKMLLLVLFTEQDWGVFGLVSNLGSIILRLLFAPIEEIAYSVFSAAGPNNSRDAQTTMLRALLLLQGGVGWLGLCYGPHFAGLAVRLLYGQSWADSEAPMVLAAYCAFLFCAAANGILEAFMYSQCPPEWVRQCTFWQVGISFVLLGVSWAFRGWGPVALVGANSLAMLLRAGLGVAFAHRHLQPSAAQLRLGPVARLLGLLLTGSLASWLFPPVGSPLRVCAAVCVAVLAISLPLALCRHELLATVRAVRRSKET
ncbi:RFT1 [Symbiodinium natans]|uniref:Protein RFT1 homolog n=1 Tax=Symbiodinium natans TaxID=878477 RepID=A0A812QNY9_9DINO|nr:RFT1 [Symbiodinium natans]